ncbi:bifunctional hydroxymethylpyrimidine kinase/phosphomethylpyrimidine kinase [Paraglaciecola marina]|uniref:bifunctional hydroxymethylpyrimidine kinase/phosphomethylpyrimidine kinase n=1 Tax=Paraglaciecola marina TaxID=2500157 RepID=UPI00105D3B6C|nr:bifunctional hydroxymethylpyrimidine kinase/phosphomethylpyrimidine kinase [Paraglaciecola marina]
MNNISNDKGPVNTGPSRPVVWSIAASDSGGGAGIQADSLTIQDLGGHACNIVTAVTAQNSQRVVEVDAVSTNMLTQQLNCLLEDMPPRAIKIGVLANVEQVKLVRDWLAENLASYKKNHGVEIPIIWDPVMMASSGQELLSENQRIPADLYLSLAKQVTLLTPNLQELQALTSDNHNQGNGDHGTLVNLSQLININILLTGGDNQSSLSVDWLAAHNIAHTSLYHQEQLLGFKGSRVDTFHNHGTGCTLSSAIATAMALGHPLLDAIVIAKAYVHQGLEYSYGLGKGPGVLARNGWPNDMRYFPEVIMPAYPKLAVNSQLAYAKVRQPLQVYTVTQSLDVLEQVLKAGARTAQLRIKAPCDENQLEQDIQQAVVLGKKYQAQVFINDHWQLAIKHAAFGVHLGQEDILQADLTQIAAAGLALGLSSHGYFEMLLVQQLSPSYLAIGHIFATPTKKMPSQPQGLLKLTRYSQLLKGRLPLVAIGGINQNNLVQLKATQVDDVAIVRGIELAADPGKSWQTLQQTWQVAP